MPRLGLQQQAQRRRRVLEAAWGCFSRNGFHATSMDDVIAASGMSASAVYHHVRGKEELIDEAAAEAGRLVDDIMARFTEGDTVPTPTDLLRQMAAEVEQRASRSDYDLGRIAIQAWAESLRRPELHERTRAVFVSLREQLAPVVAEWQRRGRVEGTASIDHVSRAIVLIFPSLVVAKHVIGDLDVDAWLSGLTALGTALSPIPGGAPGDRGPDLALPAPRP